MDNIVETLEEISRLISSQGEISQIGTVSANADTEIGGLLSDAMEHEGIIIVQNGKKLEKSSRVWNSIEDI